MIETELGNLRRTHYSKELDPSKDGSDVTVMGWVLSVRGHGNISFVTIRDKLGEIQIVAKAGNCPDDIREKISKLKEHSSIGISGMVKSSEKAPNGVEIIPKELRVFSEVEKIPPFEPQAKTVKNIDIRLEVRPIDFEEAFVDYDDVMNRIEKIIKKAIQTINDYTKENPDSEFIVPNLPKSIPRYTYTELIEKMQKAGANTEWGDDLYPSNLKKIGLEGFYFIKDWPTAPKPFYVKVSKENAKISESFDLMFGDLELSSGSTRIEKKNELAERMKNKGMKVDAFEYHLGAFDYGVPPHAGCGMGLERLMMALTGTENIRDTTFYPRDVDRLTP